MLGHEGQATGGQSETLPVEFKFEDHAVRTVQINGTIRFVATDVCEVLGLGNPSQALARLRDDEKGLTTVETLGGRQDMNVITGPASISWCSIKEGKSGRVYPLGREGGSTHHPQNGPVRSRTTRATAGNRQLSAIDKADVVRARPLSNQCLP